MVPGNYTAHRASAEVPAPDNALKGPFPLTSTDPGRAPPPWALRLGYAGLIPCVFGAALVHLVDRSLMPFTMLALAGYAATVASFLGGIHWGLAMRDAAHTRLFPYVWGAIPSVLASIAVIMPPWASLVVLGLLLAGCYAVDRRLYVHYHMQGWLQLRLRLTIVASLSCMVGAYDM